MRRFLNEFCTGKRYGIKNIGEVLLSLVPVVTGGLVIGYFYQHKQHFPSIFCLKNSHCTHVRVKPEPSLYTCTSET